MKYTSCSAGNGTFIDLKLECSRCGYSVNSNDNFCPHCGKELQSPRTTIPFRDIVDILNEMSRPTKAKDTAEEIKTKTDKAEKAIEMLDRVHNWLGELIRDSKCDDHCSKCIGASDLADDIWDVLHLENNKTIAPCMDTRTRNCDRFNTGDAEADYATAIKKYREETGKVVYNACLRYDSVGDFIIWMLSGKSLANGTVDGTLHNEGKETK